jgi:hypothetical protein
MGTKEPAKPILKAAIIFANTSGGTCAIVVVFDVDAVFDVGITVVDVGISVIDVDVMVLNIDIIVVDVDVMVLDVNDDVVISLSLDSSQSLANTNNSTALEMSSRIQINAYK